MTFYPEASGRVALFKLALTLREQGFTGMALVPDYICNVVNMALEKAGFTLLTYQTDAFLEPNPAEIEAHLSTMPEGVFVVASVFGSSAFLENLHEARIRENILQNKIHVIVDLCQDISLINSLPSGYGEHLSAVVSFNDKSFLGVMGGGILSRLPIPESTLGMTAGQIVYLYKSLLRKIYLCMRSKLTARIRWNSEIDDTIGFALRAARYEYSYCCDFPYKLEPLAITKLQVIMALIGMENLSLIYAKRRRFALRCRNVVRTRYFDTSPYLMVTDPQDPQLVRRKIKPSYAVHNHPELSLREHITIVHNKGFCDER